MIIALIVLSLALIVLLVFSMCKVAAMADEASERTYQRLTEKLDEHHAAALDAAKETGQPRRRGLRITQS